MTQFPRISTLTQHEASTFSSSELVVSNGVDRQVRCVPSLLPVPEVAWPDFRFLHLARNVQYGYYPLHRETARKFVAEIPTSTCPKV